jgi:hypothetical protein
MTLRHFVFVATLAATALGMTSTLLHAENSADDAEDPACALGRHAPVLIAARYANYAYKTLPYNSAAESASLGKAGRIAIAYDSCQDSVSEIVTLTLPAPSAPRDRKAWAAAAREVLNGLAVNAEGAALMKDLGDFLAALPPDQHPGKPLHVCLDGTQDPDGCGWRTGGGHSFSFKQTQGTAIIEVGTDSSH